MAAFDDHQCQGRSLGTVCGGCVLILQPEQPELSDFRIDAWTFPGPSRRCTQRSSDLVVS
eukprot:scaffold433417_cov42-Prasinocladus_malaysianus.AAC.1